MQRDSKFSSRTRENEQSFIKQEMIELRRVSKVTSGGRRFSFTALMVVKDERNNSVGFALSNGKEVSTAIRKSVRKAVKNSITFFTKERRTIPRDVTIKFKATKVMMKPSPSGSGLKAGASIATILKFIGLKDVSAKIIGSNNKLNTVKCTFLALAKLSGKTNLRI